MPLSQLLIFHGGGDFPYTTAASQAIFRVSFAFIAIFLAMLVYIRVFKLRNVDQSFRSSKRKHNVTGYDVQSLRLVTRHYWRRLFATSFCWFCNDFPLYANQIFRNIFLTLVTSNSSQVLTLWCASPHKCRPSLANVSLKLARELGFTI